MPNIAALLYTHIAESMSHDDIVEALETAIAEYKKDRDFTNIVAVAPIIMVKENMVRKNQTADQHINEFEQFEKFKTAFDHTKNNS